MITSLTCIISCDVGDNEGDSYNDDGNDQVVVGDQVYIPKTSLTTYVVIGCDKESTDEASGLADFICVVIIDDASKSYSLIHLNRDTVTKVHTEDKFGRSTGDVTEQLSLSYAYGVSESAKCLNTLNAVENLLLGIEIDHYFSLKLDDIAILNDMIGGVTLEVLEDFPDSDVLIAGNTVRLMGDLAVEYVQARGEMEDKTNVSRMKRQKQYLYAFIEQAKLYLSDNSDLESNEYKILQKLTTDCDMGMLQNLNGKIVAYDFNGVYSIGGNAVEENGLIAFHVDEVSLRDTVLQLFYSKK